MQTSFPAILPATAWISVSHGSLIPLSLDQDNSRNDPFWRRIRKNLWGLLEFRTATAGGKSQDGIERRCQRFNKDAAGSRLYFRARWSAGRASGAARFACLREARRSGAVDSARALNAPGFVAMTLRQTSLGRLTLRGPR